MARKYEPNLWLLNRNACLSGGVALSQATNTPWVNISQTDAISTSQAACDDCHLISEAEWMTVAANVLGVASNWSGGTVGSGFIYSGHSDNSPANSLAATTDGNTTGSNQRRTLTLTNGEVIWDFPGNGVWEWTTGTIAGGQLPGLSGEVAYVYRQWNNGSLLFNGLPSASRPSAISGTVAGYSSGNGIGSLWSNVGEAGARSFVRGGRLSSPSNAGVLALDLGNSATTSTNGTIGLRVTK
jgi:hypothetical protein